MAKRKGVMASRRKNTGNKSQEDLNKTLNQAVALHQAGQLKQAAESYKRYLNNDSTNAELLHTLGGIFYQLGELSDAIKYLQKAVELVPDNQNYLNDLGGLLLTQDAPVAAEVFFRKVVINTPDFAPLHYNLGTALLHQSRFSEALSEFQLALKLEPDYAEAHFSVGVVMQDLGHYHQAMEALKKAVKLQPYYAQIWLHLGEVFESLKHLEKAEEAFRKAVECEPDNIDAEIKQANALNEIGQTADGIDLLKMRLQKDSQLTTVMTALGRLLGNSGDLEGAESMYRKALNQKNDLAAACLGLSRIRTFNQEDTVLIEKMQGLLTKKGLSEPEQMDVHFALGKIFDDLKNHEIAFDYYAQGNRIQHNALNYDKQAQSERVDHLIDFFTPELFSQFSELGYQHDLPIIIVGMPRSGTTLTEQIIASHPDVVGGGELLYFRSVSRLIPQLCQSKKIYPLVLSELNQDIAKKLYQPYIELLRRHTETARFVTDKLPGNFMNMGLIRLLFPNAPIIHCKRDPLDVCLSIFFQIFNKSHDYSYDLLEIGHEYLQYQRLMEHWREVLPGPYMESQYEDLVAEQESNSRALIDFCDLPWDNACIEFYKKKRDVKTASNWQVRQPIYSSSSQRWKNYTNQLRPLIDLLELEV